MGKKILMEGNEAIAEAAIRAGLRAYFGYPITPQSELTEYMAKNLPLAGGTFIQSESEIAAISMIYGAAAAGGRCMTSSSGPGISLKQEGISYLAMAKLPCLIVNMMRGGSGLGGIQPSQSDYFQATRGGGHGDYRTIVLAPSTVQEAADLVPLGFDLADIYRIPVIILGDGALGQMSEPVEFKPRKKRKLPAKDWALTGALGRKPRHIVPFSLDPYIVEGMNLELERTYQKISKKEVRYELVNLDNPDIVIVAFGTMARIVKTVIKRAKEEGIEVGLIRPITLWPFPSKIIQETAKNLGKDFLTVEMNLGQMVEDVRLAVEGKTKVPFYGRAGGVIPTTEEVLDEVKVLLGKKRRTRAKKKIDWDPVQEETQKPALDIPLGMKKVYSKPEALTDIPFTYCPGCGHSLSHKLIAEVIDELGIREKTIGIFPVGCAVTGTDNFRIDSLVPAHGRPPAVATGLKRALPDRIIFAYQGDGDLAAIGTAETIHAANRWENITVIFINNAIYGMTGGQMAPTTLVGQKTSTSPRGRDSKNEGSPIRACELLSILEETTFIARVALISPKEILKAKKAIKKAFQYQIEGKGYSLVEILSPCPTNWRLSPKEAMEWIEKEMIPYFSLGVFKDKFAEEGENA